MISRREVSSRLVRFSGFSLTGKIQSDVDVESEIFSAGGYQWCIIFYPNGNGPSSINYTSIYLKLGSDRCLLHISASFLLADPSGVNPPCPVKGPDTATVNSFDRSETETNVCGYTQFIKRKELEKHPYFREDSFTIECRINILKEFCIDVVEKITPRRSGTDTDIMLPLDLQKDLASLLESGMAADVSFKVNTKTFNVHRCILAARSPVFRAQLCGPLKESTEESIVIHEMEAPVFKAVLSFIYSDFQSCPEIEDSVPMAQHLLVAADRYELERLRVICEDRLIESIDVETVVGTLALAEQLGCMQLKAACIKFMASPRMVDAVTALEGCQISNTCV